MEIDDLESELRAMSVWQRRLMLRDQNRAFGHPDRDAFNRHLYRYRTFDQTSDVDKDRLLSALAGGEIYLSSFDQFNDPFECQAKIAIQKADIAHKHLRRAAARVLAGQPRGKRRAEAKAAQKRLMVKRNAKDMLRQNVSRIGITCFSDNPHSILMWSHYAGGHTGLLIQYATYYCPSLCIAQPVKYTDDYPSVLIPSNDGSDLVNMLLTKHSGWAYERERRLIELRSSRTTIRLGEDAVRAVILGCRMPAEAKDVVCTIVKNASARRSRPVLVYEAKVADDSFELKVRRSERIRPANVRLFSAIT